MLKTGDILGGIYEITENIGSGGGGIVFRANHLRMQKPVALKLIKDDVKGILENRAEVDILKNLKNDYLPQVIDFVEDNGDVYTVMEFIEGKDFKSLVMSGRQFDEKSVTKYALQLCSAVEYLHSQTPPIIHSDIKPANIMLTPEDKICLIDFNISSVSDGSGAYSAGGSRGFAAPEQFKKIIDVPAAADEFHEETRFIGQDDDETEIIGTESMASTGTGTSTAGTKNVSKAYVDTRTDIYGVGASLCYVLTERAPLGGRPDFRGVKVSKKLKKVIGKAMAPDPKDRYKSISEMKKDLERNGTVKMSLKAAIAGALVIAAAASFAIIYPRVHVELQTNASVHIYGNEYVIETTQNKNINGIKVSDKYSATAVSALQKAYEYMKKLPFDSRSAYLSASDAAAESLRKEVPEYEIKDPGTGIFEDRLSADSEDELTAYIAQSFTNYTGKDQLYFLLSYDKGILSMFIFDDPAAAALLKGEAVSGSVNGHIGAAVTAAVNDSDIQEYEGLGFDPGELKNIAEDRIYFEFLGSYYASDEEEFRFYGSNIYGVDMSPLTQFKDLKRLFVSSCDGVDISAFPEMPTVEEISFSSSDISTIERIADKFPNLKALEIKWTGISDLSPVSELSALEELYMGYCKSVTDLSPLSGMNALTVLDISECDSVSALPDFSAESSLRTLDMSNCDGISDLYPVSVLPGLEELNVSGDIFSDGSFIDVITHSYKLRSVNLEYTKYVSGQYSNGSDITTPVSTLIGFEMLTNLEELYLGRAEVSDLLPISGLNEMKRLSIGTLGDHPIDVSDIQNMTKLEYLALDVKYPIDLSVLKNFTGLKELSIGYSTNKRVNSTAIYPYADTVLLMECISGMKSLENLTLNYIKLSDADVDKLCSMTYLKKLSVTADISDENKSRIKDSFSEETYVYVNTCDVETTDYFYKNIDGMLLPVFVGDEAAKVYDTFEKIADSVKNGNTYHKRYMSSEGSGYSDMRGTGSTYEADLCDCLGKYVNEQTGWSAAILWRMDEPAGDDFAFDSAAKEFLDEIFPDADKSKRTCLLCFEDCFYVYKDDGVRTAITLAEQTESRVSGEMMNEAIKYAASPEEIVYTYYHILLTYYMMQ